MNPQWGGGGGRGLATSANMRCLSVSAVSSYPTCGAIPLLHRQFRVSYLIQIPKAIRLNVNRCRALSSPPPPKAPVRYTCVQDPGEASLGSYFVCREDASEFADVLWVQISGLSAVNVSDGSIASVKLCWLVGLLVFLAFLALLALLACWLSFWLCWLCWLCWLVGFVGLLALSLALLAFLAFVRLCWLLFGFISFHPDFGRCRCDAAN